MKRIIPVFLILCLSFPKIYGQNVGVGNTSPNSKLDVSGDLALREGTAITVAAGANTLTLPTAKNSVYRLTGASGAFSISSISAGNDGMVLTLINATGQVMTVTNGTIQTNTGANLVGTTTVSSVNLVYNATLGKWIVTGGEGFSNSSEWNLSGNAGTTSSNFIGTTDNNPLYFKTNGSVVGYIPSSANISGNTGFGVGNGTPGGSYNVFMGFHTMAAGNTGNDNVTMGWNILDVNTTGGDNIGMGWQALTYNTTGSSNVALGTGVLEFNKTASNNIGIGPGSLQSDTTGGGNVAVGDNALHLLYNGSDNTVLGYGAGSSATGSSNLFLGYNAGANELTNNKLYIANSNTTTPLLYGDFTNQHLTVNDSLTAEYFQMTHGAALGDVLLSDANGNGAWVSPASVLLAFGHGTQNYVTKWNNVTGTTIGNSLIYDNGTNVGIGTTSPGQQLEVNGNIVAGSSASTRVQLNGAGGTNAISETYQSESHPRWAIGRDLFSSGHAGIAFGPGDISALDLYIGRSTNGDMQFQTGGNGNNRMTILSAGNVGIGTTAPDTTLQVVGKTQTTYLQVTNGATSGYVLQSDANGNGSWVNPATAANAWNLTGNSGTVTGTNYIGTSDNKALEFKVNNTKSGYIDYNAGVGNTGLGYATFNALSSGIQNAAFGYNTMGSNTSGSDNAAMGFGALNTNTTGNDNTAIGNGALSSNTTASYNTAVGWQAQTSGTTANNNVSVGHFTLHDDSTGTGNVVVGANAMANNYNGSSNTVVGYNSGSSNVGSGNIFLGNQAGSNETGSNKLYIANSNTATPLIYGDFNNKHVTVHDSLTAKYIQVSNGATNGYVLQSDASGNGSWVNPATITTAAQNIYNTDGTLTGARTVTIGSSNLSFVSSGAYILLDPTANGRTGIGTTSPISLFANTPTNILGSDGHGIVNNSLTWSVNAGGYAAAIYNGDNSASSNGLAVQTAGTTSNTRILDLSTAASQGTTGTTVMAVLGTGNVGIGTGSPQQMLSVNTGMNIDQAGGNTGTVSANALTFGNGSGEGIASNRNSGTNQYGLDFYTDYINQMSVTNAGQVAVRNNLSVGAAYASSTPPSNGAIIQGNVGIGTSSPNDLLTVGSTLITNLSPEASINTTGNQPLFVGQTTGNLGLMIGYNGNDIQGRSGTNFVNNDILVLNPYGGNVGVGTSSPGSSLTVNGTTSTTNFQMTNGGTANYIMQSDASGNGTWVSPSSISANNIYNSDGTLTGNRTVTMGGDYLNFTGGNVGIGAAGPSDNFAINGSGGIWNGNELNFYTDGGVTQKGFVGEYNSGSDLTLASVTSGNWLRIGAKNSDIAFFPDGTVTSGTNPLDVITSSGALGVGTSSPFGTFDVENGSGGFHIYNWGGSGNSVLMGEIHGNSSYGAVLRFTGPASGFMDIGQDSTGSFIINQGSTGYTRFAVNQYTGNVGIGTTTPGSTLTVSGTTSTTNFQMTNGGTANYILQSDASGNGTWVSPSSVSANNIYNADGTLTGNRTVTQAADNITFSATSGNFNYTSTGNGNVAMGNSLTSSGHNSFATGSGNTASGNQSFASGSGNTVSGNFAFVTGNGNIAAGPYSVVSGLANIDGGTDDIVGGFEDVVVAGYGHALAIGYQDSIAGSAGAVFGVQNKVRNYEGFAQGDANNVPGQTAAAFGSSNTASGSSSFVTGNTNTVNGNQGFAAGTGNASESYSEMAIGMYGTTYTPSSTSGYAATDRIFDVGNGSSSSAPSDAMTILKNGNVGIGTTAPAYKLDVNGQARASANSGGSGSAFIASTTGSNSAYGWDVTTNATDQKWWDMIAIGTQLRGRAVNDANISATNWLLVNRGSGYTVSNVNFPAGNVAIGLVGPYNMLDVAGNVALGSYAGTQTAPSNGLIVSGNVGIGTSSPTNALQVSGTTSTTNFQMTNGGTANYLLQSDASGNGIWVAPSSIAANNIYNSNGTLTGNRTVTMGADNLTLSSTTGNLIFNPSSTGKVGINTAGPQSLLANTNTNILGQDGQGVNSNSLTWMQNASGYTVAAYNAGTGATAQGLAVKIAGTAATNRLLDLSTGSAQATAGTSVMVALGNGNVGIGTGSPTSTLQVNGTTSTTNFQMTNGGTANYLLQSDASGNGTWVAPSSIAANNIYNADGTLTGARTVTMSGNTLNFTGGDVGIGTASTNATFNVNGNAVIGTGLINRAGSGLTVDYSNTTAYAANTDPTDAARSLSIVNEGSTTNEMAILSMRANANGGANNQMMDMKLVNPNNGKSNLIFSFGPNASFTDRFTMTSAGYLGIGTTAPESQLANTANNIIGQDGQGVNTNSLTWAMSGQTGYVGAFYNGDAVAGGNGLAVKVAGTASTDRILDLSTGAQTTAGTSVMVALGNGNVGIGITNPLQTLTTQYASGLWSGSETSDHGFATQTGTSSSDYILYEGADKTNGLSYIQSVRYGTAVANLGLNERGGNVGIGTGTSGTYYAPTNTLSVNGSGGFWNSNQLNFYTDNGSTNHGYVGEYTASSDFSLAAVTNGNWMRIGANNSSISFFPDNTLTTGSNPMVKINPQSSSSTAVGSGTYAVLEVWGVAGSPLSSSTTGENQNNTTYGWCSPTSPGSGRASASGRAYSIYAWGSVWSNGEFDATSDERIKDVLDTSDNASDLAAINKLNVVDYKYIDKDSHGDTKVKGFLAQQVETVFPDAVNTQPGVIPNIYRNADKVLYDAASKKLTLTMGADHGLVVGDKVQIKAEGEDKSVRVSEVIDSKTFVVEDWQKDSHQVFVFGKEVPDLRNIDYNKIFSAGISAIQELSKKTEELECENETLKAQNAALQSENSSVRSDMSKLKNSDTENAALIKTMKAQIDAINERLNMTSVK